MSLSNKFIFRAGREREWQKDSRSVSWSGLMTDWRGKRALACTSPEDSLEPPPLLVDHRKPKWHWAEQRLILFLDPANVFSSSLIVIW